MNYSYDAYGKLLSVTNAAGTTISDTSNIALINPLRYRGYYYDSETELYYLQSRYYDPATSRFINADSYASTGQDFLGYNMFAYCNNNPVNHRDDGGTFLTKIFDAFADMFNEPNSYDGGGGGTGYGFSIDGGSKGYTDDKPSERKNKKVASVSLDGKSQVPNGQYTRGRSGRSEHTFSKAQTPTNPPTSSSRGSTGRTEPANLREKLAMEQVKSNPLAGTPLTKLTLNDPRWPSSEGWVKMQQIVPTSQGNINIHYVYNQAMQIFDDFKFKS